MVAALIRSRLHLFTDGFYYPNICKRAENIYQYYNLKDLKKHAIKYDIDFNDLSTLKGNRIFNPNIYK